MSGYIYVRTHPSYGIACKLGKASNIPERDSQYATGEIHRGEFDAIYEIKNVGLIERLLQYEFRKFNIRYNAGREFYNKHIISLIEPYFNKNGFTYRKLSKQDIDALVRCNRVRDIVKKINIQSLIQCLKKPRFEPRQYQREMIVCATNYFQRSDKGLLIIPCGAGKTLISLWITQALLSNSILIGVPNTLLLNQWREVLKILFHKIPYLMVYGGVETEDINDFLGKFNKCIVLTTYASAHKVHSATMSSGYVFHMKINDECHHLTAGMMTEKKQYVRMLQIPSEKQLSLTATLKQLDDGISNDNVTYFGEIIDKKCLLWAIQGGIICDYVIQTIITKEEQLAEQFYKYRITEENEQRLFLSALSCLKSIQEGHSHHALIYSNSKENSLKLKHYIKILSEDIQIYYSDYHSEMRPSKQNEIIARYNESSRGIIMCVYCLGEGYDNPIIDCVVFSENMQSNIRIVQSALRGGRKNNLEPNKITKIICPVLNKDWFADNPDLKKVREIIYQMGLEDETISQKIKVCCIDLQIQTYEKNSHSEMDFGYFDDEFASMLRLNTMSRTSLDTTYDKAKQIIEEKHIDSKEKYYELCEKDNRIPNDPETFYKHKFISWIDYLTIDKSKYYNLEECRTKIKEYMTLSMRQYQLQLDIICKQLCKKDSLFPPCDLWEEFYSIPIHELIKFKRRERY
jgi:superfamily II DNA or RNA helicase